MDWSVFLSVAGGLGFLVSLVSWISSGLDDNHDGIVISLIFIVISILLFAIGCSIS